MSTTVCCDSLPLNPHPPQRLLHRLQALWRPLQQQQHRQRLTHALADLSEHALSDINAPEWLRRDLLHRAELEHYERMRTLSQFRGIL